MELLGPIKAFLAIALIHVSPSIGDGNGDLSTVSVDRSKRRKYKRISTSLANPGPPFCHQYDVTYTA